MIKKVEAHSCGTRPSSPHNMNFEEKTNCLQEQRRQETKPVHYVTAILARRMAIEIDSSSNTESDSDWGDEIDDQRDLDKMT